MGRLIDADALMPKLKFIREAEHQIYGKESWGFASKCIAAIEDAPTIEERPTGKWVPHDDIITLVTGEISAGGVKCNVCGLKTHNKLHKLLGCPYKFCPNCGAKMNGGEERCDLTIRINLNEPIKVKLTDWGKEIFYHRHDRTNEIAGREILKPDFPKEDENGYTEFLLWEFMELYGMYIGMAQPNVIEPLEFYYKHDRANEIAGEKC